MWVERRWATMNTKEKKIGNEMRITLATYSKNLSQSFHIKIQVRGKKSSNTSCSKGEDIRRILGGYLHYLLLFFYCCCCEIFINQETKMRRFGTEIEQKIFNIPK